MMQDNPTVARLKARLDPERPAIAMAAHNLLAAKLAAAAGFDAIWGSGFELSTSYAVPDANILSVNTHLELMRAIGEVQDAPVIADLDTGYGNAVNVAYLVPRYTAAGVAAVVIEDKTFPKIASGNRENRSSSCWQRRDCGDGTSGRGVPPECDRTGCTLGRACRRCRTAGTPGRGAHRRARATAGGAPCHIRQHG
jgi:phosphoenolpyruvate phosphomutase-like protein